MIFLKFAYRIQQVDLWLTNAIFLLTLFDIAWNIRSASAWNEKLADSKSPLFVVNMSAEPNNTVGVASVCRVDID